MSATLWLWHFYLQNQAGSGRPLPLTESCSEAAGVVTGAGGDPPRKQAVVPQHTALLGTLLQLPG